MKNRLDIAKVMMKIANKEKIVGKYDCLLRKVFNGKKSITCTGAEMYQRLASVGGTRFAKAKAGRLLKDSLHSWVLCVDICGTPYNRLSIVAL